MDGEFVVESSMNVLGDVTLSNVAITGDLAAGMLKSKLWVPHVITPPLEFLMTQYVTRRHYMSKRPWPET